MDVANITISVYYFLLLLPVIGMTYYWGYRDGKKKMKVDRDLHLRARIKAEEAYDRLRGKYLLYKGMVKSKKGD